MTRPESSNNPGIAGFDCEASRRFDCELFRVKSGVQSSVARFEYLQRCLAPMPLLRAQPTLRQSVPMGQRAGRPRRANSDRADGFCCMPWDWRDHLIGARGSVACANVSVCPARTPDPPAVVAGRRRIKPPDLRGRWIRVDVSACSIPGQQAIQSGVAGGCAEALELFALATEACAAAIVVAPTAWHIKRTI